MTGPVVLVDRDGWLYVEWSLADAAASVELTDVEDGEYVAVDGPGRRVDVVVEPTGEHVDQVELRRLLELALPEEQRVGDGPGDRSLVDCLSRLPLHRGAERLPHAAVARLRTLLGGAQSSAAASDRD